METCIIPGILGCELSISHQPQHNGGGPFFIEHFLSKDYILNKLNPTDSIMEMCSGPGFMGFYIAQKLKLKKAVFVDINPAVEKEYFTNKERVDFDVEFCLSSAFNNYSGEKVDLIVLNPPHLVNEEDFLKAAKEVPGWFPTATEEQEKQSRLILLDEDFAFHKSFCRDVYNHLTSFGQIAFLENEKYIPHKRLEEHLGGNFDFEFIQTPETRLEGYYLLIATKKQ